MLQPGPGCALPHWRSRNLFADWAEDPRNAIIFVTTADEGTLAERVQQLAGSGGGPGPGSAAPGHAPPQQQRQQPVKKQQRATQAQGLPPGAPVPGAPHAQQPAARQQEQQGQQQQEGQEAPRIQMVRYHRVPLEGQELEEHLQAQAEAAAAAAAEAAARDMEVEAAAAAAAAAAGGGSGPASPRSGGILSPRASGAVPRVNSLAIGHLKSSGGVGEVVAADGAPVEGLREEAVAAAACLVEGFEAPRVRRALGECQLGLAPGSR